MRLVVYCPGCSSKNNVTKRAQDRYKLSQKLGDEFDFECANCSTVNHYSVDEVTAVNGFSGLVYFLIAFGAIAVGFFLLKQYFTISTWWLIPVLIAVPVSFYVAISKEENNKIRSFNKFKLKS